MTPLGAAGCWCAKWDRFCVQMLRNENHFKCRKYGALETHPNEDQPWRHKQCGDDAMTEGWSEIMKAR